jgi:glycosyltransferase involved in cell wall biosynthesis
MNPSISVVIPARNRERTIGECLDSVLGQSYPAAEVIVVDDGSYDATASVAASRRGVRVLALPHSRGAQAARNAGVRSAAHGWIAFQDSDDTWEPDRLALQVERMRTVPRPEEWVFHCDGMKVGPGEPAGRIDNSRFSGHCFAELLQSPGPMFQGLLLHRDRLEQIGMLDEECLSYQEWDTAIRLAQVAPFAHVPVPLFNWMRHQGETISASASRDFRGFLYVTCKHAHELVRAGGPNAWKKAQARLLIHGMRLGCFDEILALEHRGQANLAFPIARCLARIGRCPPGLPSLLRLAGALSGVAGKAGRVPHLDSGRGEGK